MQGGGGLRLVALARAMSAAVLLVESTFAPPQGRTFYLVGKVQTGPVRVGMRLALPYLKDIRIDCTVRTVEHTTEPDATCVGIRYRDARERAALLALDLAGRIVLVE
jgi:hypothetical protein